MLIVDALSGERPEDVFPVAGLAEAEYRGAPSLTSVEARVKADDTISLVYTSGTTGPPKRRADHPPECDGRGAGFLRMRRAARRVQAGLISPDGPHRRAGGQPLAADGARRERHLPATWVS